VQRILPAQCLPWRAGTFPRLLGPLCPTQNKRHITIHKFTSKSIRSDLFHFQDVHEQGALLGHAVAKLTSIRQFGYLNALRRAVSQRLGIKLHETATRAKAADPCLARSGECKSPHEWIGDLFGTRDTWKHMCSPSLDEASIAQVIMCSPDRGTTRSRGLEDKPPSQALELGEG
jgi:hypothetical protein